MKNMLKKTKFLQEEEPMRFVIQRVTYASVSVNQKTKETCAIVQSGEFGTNIKISLENDGPFTIVLDSNDICPKYCQPRLSELRSSSSYSCHGIGRA